MIGENYKYNVRCYVFVYILKLSLIYVFGDNSLCVELFIWINVILVRIGICVIV